MFNLFYYCYVFVRRRAEREALPTSAVRGQLLRVGSLLPPQVPGIKLRNQACIAAALPTDPSCQPLDTTILFKNFNLFICTGLHWCTILRCLEEVVQRQKWGVPWRHRFEPGCNWTQWTYMCHSTHGDFKGQLVRVLSYQWVSGLKLGFSGLVASAFYLLSHLAGPIDIFFKRAFIISSHPLVVQHNVLHVAMTQLLRSEHAGFSTSSWVWTLDSQLAVLSWLWFKGRGLEEVGHWELDFEVAAQPHYQTLFHGLWGCMFPSYPSWRDELHQAFPSRVDCLPLKPRAKINLSLGCFC